MAENRIIARVVLQVWGGGKGNDAVFDCEKECLGYPMAIRAIETGAMDGRSWPPPLNLVWAVLCWWAIDKRKKRA